MRPEILAESRRMMAARMKSYEDHVKTYRDLDLKIQFTDRKHQATSNSREKEEDPEIHIRRREQLRELYREEEERATVIMENQLRLSREVQEKELEERAAKIAAEREFERQRLVEEKLRQRELETSQECRRVLLEQQLSDQREILRIQVREKQRQAQLEAEEKIVFDALLSEEDRKKNFREQTDRESAIARAKELKQALDEQVSQIRRSKHSNESDQSIPDNCFWNGTLRSSQSRVPTVIRETPPPKISDRIAEKQREREENAQIVKALMEAERQRTIQEIETKRKQRENMRIFFEENRKERLQNKEIEKEVDRIVNESCERASQALESRKREEEQRRASLLKETLAIRNRQVSEIKANKERYINQKEQERVEAERIARIVEVDRDTVKQENLSRMKEYKESLLKQIFEKQTVGP